MQQCFENSHPSREPTIADGEFFQRGFMDIDTTMEADPDELLLDAFGPGMPSTISQNSVSPTIPYPAFVDPSYYEDSVEATHGHGTFPMARPSAELGPNISPGSPSGSRVARTRYRCPEPDCGCTFSRNSDLRRHTHQNSQNFPCPEPHCNRSGSRGFKRRDKLYAHMRNVHHNAKPLKSGGPALITTSASDKNAIRHISVEQSLEKDHELLRASSISAEEGDDQGIGMQ